MYNIYISVAQQWRLSENRLIGSGNKYISKPTQGQKSKRLFIFKRGQNGQNWVSFGYNGSSPGTAQWILCEPRFRLFTLDSFFSYCRPTFPKILSLRLVLGLHFCLIRQIYLHSLSLFNNMSPLLLARRTEQDGKWFTKLTIWHSHKKYLFK